MSQPRPVVYRGVTLTALLVITSLAWGCGIFRLGVRAEGEGMGFFGTEIDRAQLELFIEYSSEEDREAVQTELCQACASFLNLRNTFRRLADEQQFPDEVRQTYSNMEESYQALVDECVEVQAVMGQCPHQQ